MCAVVGGRAVPDFGAVLDRGRLVRAVSNLGGRPCVIYGPSGSGKSVVAAQYVSSARSQVIWIDAGGECIPAKRLAGIILKECGCAEANLAAPLFSEELALPDLLDAVVRCLRSESLAGNLCVVLDDLGRVPDSNLVCEIGAIGKALWRCASQLIVTTRQLDNWPPKVLCESGLVGPDELGLTLSEAQEMLHALGMDMLASEAPALHEACGGHLAFFTVLSSQALIHGANWSAMRTVPLNAWLERLIYSELTASERDILFRTTLLRSGDGQDLDALDVPNTTVIANRLASVLPLFKMTKTHDSRCEFRVHDLVDDFFAERQEKGVLHPDSVVVTSAVTLLTNRLDYARAAELLLRMRDIPRIQEWLDLHGEEALGAGNYTSLARLVDAIPVASMMAQPKLLVLWAELNAEMGNVEDALSRCRAAKLLAEHDGDVDVVREALALSLVYLRQLNRKDEAKAFAEEILASHHVEDDKALLAQTLVCLGYNRIIHGEMVEAKAFLDQANEVVSGADFPGPRRVVREAIEASSIVSALAFGDFNSTVRILGPLIGEKQGLLSSRVTVRGNVAVALAETGRLDRCEALLRAVVQDIERNKLDLFAMAFYPALGCALAARGAIPEAIGWFREAIRIAIQSGDEPDVASARVYLASILRAAGDLDESLIEAERAFEHLSMSDYMAYRRLAALEVAASLLALGDPSAARAWTESVAANGFQGNRYHALRADMILAEIERRDGELDAAVARLATHRDYVLSENPNWQIAMYCRAFPALLGMFALAVGSKCLPSHMLRMIPPEHAERILLESRCFLDDATWEQLGLRLLGESEFRNLLARGGLPLCHVRLFGGLEVSIGGNTIRERDWKKRKARLLFTMLVVRRGHDIPRDQICEHLWPEMEEERAVSNLYVIWSTMKTTLGGGADKNKPSAYVESVGGVCRIVRDRVRSDVDDFEESLQRAREAEAANDAKAALRAYERIGDIYRGDLLPGDCYDDWFANLREHYRTEFVDAMQRAAQLLVSRDDPANALVFVRRAIQCDQYREDLYQSALRCQIAAGQRSSAIDTYLQCRDRLSDELGLDPSAETCALYSAILAMEARPQTPLVDPLAD